MTCRCWSTKLWCIIKSSRACLYNKKIILGETFSNPVNLKSASEDSHQGAWTCIAENQFSESDRKSVQIVVPKKSSMRDSGPRVVQPHVGSVLTLSCEAEIDQKFEDSAKYFWSRNGENFENGAKSIFEKDVSDLGTETNGIYKCRSVQFDF